MKLLRPCGRLLAFAVVALVFVAQVSAQTEGPAAPSSGAAAASTAASAPAPAKKSWRNRVGDLAAKLKPGHAAAKTDAKATASEATAPPPAPVTAKKSWRTRIGGLAAKLTPGHSSRAKEPRLSKPGPVKRHAPDSALAAEAKASLRTKQFGAALQELRTAAEHGDVQSQYLLGLVYASGVGPELSLPEARRWLEAAAEKSNPEAALALSGLLAEQDRAAAQLWLARAAS